MLVLNDKLLTVPWICKFLSQSSHYVVKLDSGLLVNNRFAQIHWRTFLDKTVCMLHWCKQFLFFTLTLDLPWCTSPGCRCTDGVQYTATLMGLFKCCFFILSSSTLCICAAQILRCYKKALGESAFAFEHNCNSLQVGKRPLATKKTAF